MGGRALANFKNGDDFEKWLANKPREVAATLAARAVLRVLPVIWTTVDRKGIDLALRAFRASAVVWSAAQYPSQATKLAPAAYEAAVLYLPLPNVADAAGHASNAAAYAAHAASVHATPHDVPSTISSAARAYGTISGSATIGEGIPGAFIPGAFMPGPAMLSSELLWSALSNDASRIDVGSTPAEVASLRLWPQYQLPVLTELWKKMKRDLKARGEGWDVWTDWYEARLHGEPAIEDLEIARATIPNEIWDQGPAAVNAEIKRLIGEYEPPSIEAIPPQEPAATQFTTNAQGLIDVVPDPLAPETLTDPLQREIYEETRIKAQALVTLGPNQLGEVNGPATRFLDGLPETIEDLSVTRAWLRGNALRSRVKAHDLSAEKADPDPARLPPLVAETLRDVVHSWNLFIIGDPQGRELDEKRLGPRELENARQQIGAQAPILSDLQNTENVATRAAIDAIVEQNTAAIEATPGIDGNQAVELSTKTTRNFIAELLRRAYAPLRRETNFAWKELRAGVYRTAGPAAVGTAAFYWPAIASFIARNADAFKAFVETAWRNPTLLQIIDTIVKAIS